MHLCRSVSLPLALVALLLVAGCRSGSTPSEAPSSAPASVSADTWATVDGRAITRDQVDKAFRRTRNLAQTLAQEEELTAKLTILDDLILEDLIMARASALKIEVPASELDTAYNEAKSNIPDAAFQEELARRSITAEDMREGLRRQLVVQKVLEREVGSKITVTDQQISEFFNANRAQFNLAEDAFHVAQIVITPVREPRLSNRTGDDATTAQAAAAKAQMLMAKLKEGAVFADLARDYSEDIESAPRGGDMGFIPRSALAQVPPALRQAIVTAPAGTVRVVEQGGGQALVVVVAKEAAGQRELDSPGVRDQITNALRGRREQLLRAAYLTALRGDATVENYEAQRVVEAQGVPR